jgi:Flp pilus assembly pilin Flp
MFRKLRGADRGAVMVEYAFLLIAVGLPAIAGLTAGGRLIYLQYREARDTMLAPFP